MRRTIPQRHWKLPEHKPTGRKAKRRTGAASLEYVLVLGAMLPMIAATMWMARQVMNLAYEWIYVLVSWPFL